MRKRPGAMGNMGNMNNMIKQAQKMQMQVSKIQDEVAQKEFDITAGGGAVSLKITGEKVIKELALDPEIVDPDDIEMLQDLVVAAVNEAIRTVDDYSSQRMKEVTGGIPGGLF